MARLITWDADTAKQELSKRLSAAKRARQIEEVYWEENERTIFSTRMNVGSLMAENATELLAQGIDTVGTSDAATNYAFKNLRFIHSQLASNPPSVVVRPTSNDVSDRRKSDAADRLIRYAIRKYKMQDKVDLCSLNTLIYGTGILKQVWDSQIGEILEFDEETCELTMEGDIGISLPSPWNFFIDPDANTWEEVRYVFERVTMPYDEACYRFPSKEAREILQELRKQSQDRILDRGILDEGGRQSDIVEFFQYWETGLPLNGMLGRFAHCTEDGRLLEPMRANPHRFRPVREEVNGPADLVRKLPERAQLPYHVFTDVDVPGRIWGRSVVSYASALQESVNRLDSMILDALEAHGVARLILPEGVELAEDTVSNDSFDVIKTTGSRDPKFIEPMTLPANLTDMRDRQRMGIDDTYGVNENMFGQQSREQSGFSMQYATNQGNMIRRRLFNKYVFLVEGIYKSLINITRSRWDTERIIYVLGKEKAFEAYPLKGADVDGGFDLVVEYGAAFSLDPVARRQEILQMMPAFEKAGIPMRRILRHLKYSEMEGLYDSTEMAYDRQMEIFEEMREKQTYIAPEEDEDHLPMMEYALYYRMTSEFKYLDDTTKQLIKRHIKERAALQSPPPQAAPAAPAPAPI